jgi:hypothetical protein
VSIQGDAQEELDKEFYEPQLVQLRLARDSAVAMSEERLREAMELRALVVDLMRAQSAQILYLQSKQRRFDHLLSLAEGVATFFEKSPAPAEELFQVDFIQAFIAAVKALR